MNAHTEVRTGAEASHAMSNKDVLLLIDGQWRPSTEGARFTRCNPLDSQLFTTACAAKEVDAIAAVNAASEAFAKWSKVGPGERRKLLNRAALELESRLPAFHEAMTTELGATDVWIRRNVANAATTIREAAALTTQIAGEVIPSNVPGNVALAIRQPAGVVLGIAPWNAPVTLAVRAIATPLACGNTVVLKGSEFCPRTHALIAEAFHEAGFPAGVVNFLIHEASDAANVVEAMIQHSAVRRVNFTGSTRVGRIIAQLCAKNLKPVVLELGGKAPFVVLEDAELPAAVSAALFGAFGNSGQICMSSERLIVIESVADAFVSQLVKRVDALSLGDPRQGQFALGPVADLSTVKRCNAMIDDALSKGAVLACGGKSDSCLMPATLLDHVTSDMDIYYNETFGPVKAIVRVRDPEHAVQTANDSAYGLSAAVFSRDIARAWSIAARIESGICHINGATVHDEPQMPFGGLRDSGLGRFGGKAGIEAFTETRWLTMQTVPREFPF